jgi:hypothetical protein
MARRIFVGWAVLFFTGLLAIGAAAFAANEDVELTIPVVKGAVVGKPFRIDRAFGQQNSLRVRAPFSSYVPISKEFETQVVNAPKPGNAYIKFNFTTPDNQPLENVQFIEMTIPMTHRRDRMRMAARLLGGDGFKMAVTGREKAQRDYVRSRTIGPYDAVEVIGRYEDPQLGLVFVRLVGILNPNDQDSVFAIANIVASKVPINAPEDLANTRSGAVISKLTYLRR